VRSLLLQFCLPLLMLLLSAAAPASGAVSVRSENRAAGVFGVPAESAPEESWHGTQDRLRDTADWGCDFAPDVRDGPNLYAYVRQNPWSSFDPEGLQQSLPAIAKDPELLAIWMDLGGGSLTTTSSVATTTTTTITTGAAAATTTGEIATAIAVGGGGAVLLGTANSGSMMPSGDQSAKQIQIQSEEEAEAKAQPQPSSDGAGARKGGGTDPPKRDLFLDELDRQIEIIKEFKAGKVKEAAKGVDLTLKYKAGWTEAQRTAADTKAAALTKANTFVTPPVRSGTAQAKYRREQGLGPSVDADHTVDLQLGGADTILNMSGVDSSVNRSLGSQINNQIKNLPAGTRVNNVRMVDR
jgi:hypothetical protein